MTTHIKSLSTKTLEPQALLGPTLADVLVRIPGLAEVSVQARHNMTSAINTVARVLDRPPFLVPIAAPALRKLMSEAQPAAVGLSPSRWRNVKCDVHRAIKMSGLSTAAKTAVLPLSDSWTQLVDRVADRFARSVIRKFGRFCSSCQVAPEDADNSTLSRYLEYLEANQLARVPARSVGVLVRAWNKHIAGSLVGLYHPLTPLNRSRKYALDWEDLPASLSAEVKAFHEAQLHPDPFERSSRKAVSPHTITNRDFLIRRLAAALVVRGIEKDDLQSLGDLFRLERLKEGLRFFLEREGDQPCTQVPHYINLALVIGKRWIHLPDDQIAEFKLLARQFHRPQNGLTEKNRTRLRQFADDKVIAQFLGLSRQLIAKAQKMPLSCRSALLVQTALAIEILTFAPMRIGNLVGLNRQQHFHWARHDGKRVLHIVLPADEVKNTIDLEYPLPPDLSAMLDTYMTTYQPLLARGRKSGFLFPGMKGGHKQQAGFSRKISATILQETGLKVYPHLFRHFAALMFLMHHPGNYEEVRRILGHKRIETTLRNYAGMETAAALRRYDEIVLARRNAPLVLRGHKKAAA